MLRSIQRVGLFASLFSMLLMGDMSLKSACSQESSSGQDERGPEIGAKAPEFTLPNQSGDDVSLEQLLEESNVALVFYRSASW